MCSQNDVISTKLENIKNSYKCTFSIIFYPHIIKSWSRFYLTSKIELYKQKGDDLFNCMYERKDWPYQVDPSHLQWKFQHCKDAKYSSLKKVVEILGENKTSFTNLNKGIGEKNWQD